MGRPFDVGKLINLGEFSLFYQECLDDDGIVFQFRIWVISHTVAVTAMSINYVDESP